MAVLQLTIVVLAFGIGYLINQGGTCAVAASREVVAGRPPSLFLGFALAAGTAGLVTLPLAQWLGPAGHLAGGGAFGWPLLLGACLVAIGAVLNDACLLGSLWRLGNGEIRLLLLPVGLAIGFYAVQATHFGAIAAAQPRMPSLAIVVSAFALLALLAAAVLILVDRNRMAGQIPLVISMALLGIAGSVLFVVRPGWTYADVVRLAVAPPMKMISRGIGIVLPASMTIIGALVAAIQARTFRLTRLNIAAVVRTLFGGAIMAFGAALIPGGNDSLLLGAIPSGSQTALAAYLLMNLMIFVLIALIGKRTALARQH